MEKNKKHFDTSSDDQYRPVSITRREIPIVSNDSSNKPVDTCYILYLAFLFQGMALLFPYNAFIFLLDFYQEKFCNLHLFYWSMVMITIGFNALFCLFTNLLSDYISVTKRILTGHILYLIALVFFLVFSTLLAEGVFNYLPDSIGYTLLLAGVFTGAGIGVSQPSYYGICSQLPSRYTQALVVGETVSGITSALFRIITKLVLSGNHCQSIDTLAYIGLTLLIMIMSVFVWAFIYCHKYTRYSIEQLREGSFAVEYRVLEQEREESLDVSGVSSHVESVPTDERTLLFGIETKRLNNIWYVLMRSLRRKLIIFKKTCFLHLTLFFNFTITLFLFPTFITAAYSCHPELCDMVPIISLTIFVTTDFFIRWFTLIKVRCSSFVLFLISLLRVLFIPLICLFIFPLDEPIILVEYGLPIFFVVIGAFGLTNGYFGSVPLVIIPSKLKAGDRQSGSSMGIFMLVIALVFGELLAFPFNETVLYKASNNTGPCCIGNNSIPLILNNTANSGACTWPC